MSSSSSTGSGSGSGGLGDILALMALQRLMGGGGSGGGGDCTSKQSMPDIYKNVILATDNKSELMVAMATLLAHVQEKRDGEGIERTRYWRTAIEEIADCKTEDQVNNCFVKHRKDFAADIVDEKETNATQIARIAFFMHSAKYAFELKHNKAITIEVDQQRKAKKAQKKKAGSGNVSDSDSDDDTIHCN
jgi:hypothetical protein